MVVLIPEQLELQTASKLPLIEVAAKHVSRSPSPQAICGYLERITVKSVEPEAEKNPPTESVNNNEVVKAIEDVEDSSDLDPNYLEAKEDDSSNVDFTKENDLYEFRELAGKGTGCIALRRIFPGEVIMTEYPWIVVPDAVFQDTEKTEKMIDKAVERMNADQIAEFLSLTDCRNPDDPTYLGIFYTNDMNYDGDCALFPRMARINHSCRANGEFTSRVDQGLQRLVANYTIEEGEEITINYMAMADEGSDIRDVRRAYLREWYTFQCTCNICVLEDDEVAADDKIREELKELQANPLEDLSIEELELIIEKMYSIHGKLSYILDVLVIIYRKTVDSADQYLVGMRGLNLAIHLFGGDSIDARFWRDRTRFNESTRLELWQSISTNRHSG